MGGESLRRLGMVRVDYGIMSLEQELYPQLDLRRPEFAVEKNASLGRLRRNMGDDNQLRTPLILDSTDVSGGLASTSTTK
jgi:hypothetical protein